MDLIFVKLLPLLFYTLGLCGVFIFGLLIGIIIIRKQLGVSSSIKKEKPQNNEDATHD